MTPANLAPVTTARPPQQQRSRLTRQRLLDAAFDSLVERGWTHSTVAEVAERAGVSRGAAQHHFPTREALMSAAVEHVTLKRAAIINDDLNREIISPPPDSRRIQRAVELIVGWFVGPTFRASLTLWVAAASEPELRELLAPLEAQAARVAYLGAVRLLNADEAKAGVPELIQATLDFSRGLGLAALVTEDRAQRARVIRRWASTLERVLPGKG